MLLSSTFRILSDLNALSSDGRCKTLDASADGYGRGEGFASIYVRNMLASSEHDRMNDKGNYSAKPTVSILGGGVNQDGRSSTFTAPYGPSQERLIIDSLIEAFTTPVDVKQLSLHGTGTSLGDPIEIGAAGRALCGEAYANIALISSKSYLGHTEGTAGLSGLLISVASAMQMASLSLKHCRAMNPYVVTTLTSLFDTGSATTFYTPRSALMPLTVNIRDMETVDHESVITNTSSFGMSGVNAHCILTSKPWTGHSANRDNVILTKNTEIFWCTHRPRLLRNTANCLQEGTCRFTTSLDESTLAFLKDHVVNGSTIFPGAAYLEAAHAASTPLSEGNTALNAIAFIRPLMFRAGINISVVSTETGSIDITTIDDERTTAFMQASSRRQETFWIENIRNSDRFTFFNTHNPDLRRSSNYRPFSCYGTISSPLTKTFDGAFAVHPSRVDAMMHVAAARNIYSKDDSFSEQAPQEPLIPATVQLFFVLSTVPDCKAGFGAVCDSSDHDKKPARINNYHFNVAGNTADIHGLSLKPALVGYRKNKSYSSFPVSKRIGQRGSQAENSNESDDIKMYKSSNILFETIWRAQSVKEGTCGTSLSGSVKLIRALDRFCKGKNACSAVRPILATTVLMQESAKTIIRADVSTIGGTLQSTPCYLGDARRSVSSYPVLGVFRTIAAEYPTIHFGVHAHSAVQTRGKQKQSVTAS